MRFLIIRRADADTEAGKPASEELVEAMSQYNQELVRAGALLDAAGLAPSSAGAIVEFSGGGTTVIDGPFAEAKELIAGYTMVRADSLQEVVELVKRWPTLDGGGNVEIEIRRIAETDEYDMSDELKEKEHEMRATTEANREA
ncbi:YciI family protein [Actinophytocola gossypii]|uniref:YciI family protein n=1 Tax=Actinophytocola gossypii TaxID=2812003 RepID=A0ABT2J6A2_9PSEU|nr:YciI family protein [Actinophytocola gossypii]MCT2583397.1 YciI family protein [Actinophytocola gossypii]